MPECDHELQLDPWCCWEKALFSLIHLPPTFWNKTLLALCTPSLLRLVVPASRGRTQHLLLHPQKRPCGPSAPPPKAHAVSVHPSPSLPGISRVLHPFQRRGPPTAWARPRYLRPRGIYVLSWLPPTPLGPVWFPFRTHLPPADPSDHSSKVTVLASLPQRSCTSAQCVFSQHRRSSPARD